MCIYIYIYIYLFIYFIQMYNQPHVIYLKVTTLKQINNCPKYYICKFITMFRKTFP